MRFRGKKGKIGLDVRSQGYKCKKGRCDISWSKICRICRSKISERKCRIQFNVSSYEDKSSDRSKKKGRIERCENSRGKGTCMIGR